MRRHDTSSCHRTYILKRVGSRTVVQPSYVADVMADPAGHGSLSAASPDRGWHGGAYFTAGIVGGASLIWCGCCWWRARNRYGDLAGKARLLAGCGCYCLQVGALAAQAA